MSNADAPGRWSVSDWALVALAWLAVMIPLLWGVWQTAKKAAVLFR